MILLANANYPNPRWRPLNSVWVTSNTHTNTCVFSPSRKACATLCRRNVPKSRPFFDSSCGHCSQSFKKRRYLVADMTKVCYWTPDGVRLLHSLAQRGWALRRAVIVLHLNRPLLLIAVFFLCSAWFRVRLSGRTEEETHASIYLSGRWAERLWRRVPRGHLAW